MGGVDVFCGFLDSLVVGYVEFDHFDRAWKATGLQRLDGGFAFVCRTGSKKDMIVALGKQLIAELETDAAVACDCD